MEEQGFLNQVDDMQRYQQGKLGEAMVAGANNPGGSSVGDFLGAGMGMALGQQMGGAVAGPRQAGPAPAAAPPPLPTATQYHVEQNRQAGGPYTAAQLQQYIAGGAVTRQTLVGRRTWPGGRRPDRFPSSPRCSRRFRRRCLLGCLRPDRARSFRRLFERTVR